MVCCLPFPTSRLIQPNNFTIAYLESQYAAEVEDVILNPSAEKKYDTYKHELIKMLSISDKRKLEQLRDKEEIGDRH